MFIGDGYLEFKSRGKIYRINPGDIFMNNGACVLFLPHHRLYRGFGNPLAQEVPKGEWELLERFLARISYDEIRQDNPFLTGYTPAIDVGYFEFI